MVEYNANFDINDSKSILPPEDGEQSSSPDLLICSPSPPGHSWERWDHTTYQGASLLASKRLMERFHYSMAWSNKVGAEAREYEMAQ